MFERLDDELRAVAEHIGLPEAPRLPWANGSYRKDERAYREILSDEDREKIRRVFAREIAHFGYTW